MYIYLIVHQYNDSHSFDTFHPQFHLTVSQGNKLLDLIDTNLIKSCNLFFVPILVYVTNIQCTT